MREWMRRNWLETTFCAAMALWFFGVGRESCTLTAHAQEPAEQSKSYGCAACGTLKLEKASDLSGWIEQHCVAVLTEKHTVHHKLTATAPSFDDRMEWDDEVPEQVLKLRCTPDKEQK